MADLAFIATRSAPRLTSAHIISAAAELGMAWTEQPSESADGPMSFETNGATIVVMPIEAKHPDIENMPVGPTGADPADLAATQGHVIVTALGLTGDQATADVAMASCATVVAAAVELTAPGDAVGAMLGHNVYFHRADVFHQLVVGATPEGLPPIPLLMSVTVAGDGSGRMSFLSHGMDRYGNEDIYVTCSVDGTGAVPFVYDTLGWFFQLDEPLPTGDTIGRDDDEHITVQRVPSPARPDHTVVKLDLD